MLPTIDRLLDLQPSESTSSSINELIRLAQALRAGEEKDTRWSTPQNIKILQFMNRVIAFSCVYFDRLRVAGYGRPSQDNYAFEVYNLTDWDLNTLGITLARPPR
jgi:hypothetical protein